VKVEFRKSFEKDIRKLPEQKIKNQLKDLIFNIQSASGPGEIHNIKKLKGTSGFYRIRMGDYRIGIEIIKDKLIFFRILHRKDLYKYFPPSNR